MFKLSIKTDNAAFDGPNGDACEVARILRTIASHLENGETEGRAMDYNGNSVGEWHLAIPRRAQKRA